MLEVIGAALVGVSSSHRNAIQRQIKDQERQEEKRAEEASRRERIRRGIYHDGRLDCVSGNGIMSELGIGDELMTCDDMERSHGDVDEKPGEKSTEDREEAAKEEAEEESKQQMLADFKQSVSSSKRLHTEWSVNIGEHILDIQTGRVSREGGGSSSASSASSASSPSAGTELVVLSKHTCSRRMAKICSCCNRAKSRSKTPALLQRFIRV